MLDLRIDHYYWIKARLSDGTADDWEPAQYHYANPPGLDIFYNTQGDYLQPGDIAIIGPEIKPPE